MSTVTSDPPEKVPLTIPSLADSFSSTVKGVTGLGLITVICYFFIGPLSK